MSEEGLEAEPPGNGLVCGLSHLRVFAAGHLVPPSAQLEAVLADANDLETLTGLQNLVSAHAEVAKKCDIVFAGTVERDEPLGFPRKPVTTTACEARSRPRHWA